MKIIIFVLLFFILPLCAIDMKVKTKQKTNEVFLKILIKHNMMSIKEAERKTKRYGVLYETSYVNHITIKADGRVVYDVSMSASLPRNPILKLHYTSISKSDEIKIIVTTNAGEKTEKSVKIRKGANSSESSRLIPTLNIIDYRVKRPKIWEVITIDDAIKELYGLSKIVDEKYPEQLCGNLGGSLPLVISTKKSIRSISVFNELLSRPTVAVFNTPVNDSIYYLLPLSTEREDTYYGGKGRLIIILEDVNGDLHKIIQNFIVAHMHAHCNGNNIEPDY